MKIALLVAYDGTPFRGFARQPRQRTVQGELELALSDALRTPITTTGAGRTDAGVHAAGQVVSFEAPDRTDPAWAMMRVNKRLGPAVAVRDAAAVPDGFDARFSARWRSYEYRMYRGEAPDPFSDRFALHVPAGLDVRAMRAGAKALVGEHDFTSFCRADGRSLVRRLTSLTIRTPGDGRIVVAIRANAFCHQMVRSIVGLLLDVGRGRREPTRVAEVLAARDRSAAGEVAPPKGLHLIAVGYRPNPFG